MGDRVVWLVECERERSSVRVYAHWGGGGILRGLLGALDKLDTAHTGWRREQHTPGRALAELVRVLDSCYCEALWGIDVDSATDELTPGDAGVVVLHLNPGEEPRVEFWGGGYLEETFGHGPHDLREAALEEGA